MIFGPIIVAMIIVLIVTGLSVRANIRFRDEGSLPMQWRISRAEPLSDTVVWSAPRIFALSLTPILATGVLAAVALGSLVLTPRPGQEWMLLPCVVFIGTMFLAAHVLHLRLIAASLRPNHG